MERPPARRAPRFAASISPGPPPVITVSPAGDGSHVTWTVDAKPDEMADLMVTIYQQALDALKAHIEG